MRVFGGTFSDHQATFPPAVLLRLATLVFVPLDTSIYQRLQLAR